MVDRPPVLRGWAIDPSAWTGVVPPVHAQSAVDLVTGYVRHFRAIVTAYDTHYASHMAGCVRMGVNAFHGEKTKPINRNRE